MGFFENELQKMFGKGSPIRDVRFVGRTCIGRLGDTTNVKLEFVELGTYQRYEGIKASIFNRNEGAIDSNVFRFLDILGTRPGTGTNAKGAPYVWVYSSEPEWYGYQPKSSDYATIARAINSYLEVFLEPTQLTKEAEKSADSRSDGYTSVKDAIQADKGKARQPREKSATGKKNGKDEL